MITPLSYILSRHIITSDSLLLQPQMTVALWIYRKKVYYSIILIILCVYLLRSYNLLLLYACMYTESSHTIKKLKKKTFTLPSLCCLLCCVCVLLYIIVSNQSF